jgi:hypothetical protein
MNLLSALTLQVSMFYKLYIVIITMSVHTRNWEKKHQKQY